MKTYLDLEHWPRKEHFHFFRKMEEPFWGITIDIDCTQAYEKAKSLDISFFIYYLHKTLVAVNKTESLRYRIEGEKIAIYDCINASATISREDGSFGFSLIPFHADVAIFCELALIEIERVKKTPGLFTRAFEEADLIHFSSLPWLNFTALSHARGFAFADSCPKISFGKMCLDQSGKRTMSMSVHVHHGLADGLHVGQFVDCFEEIMNQ